MAGCAKPAYVRHERNQLYDPTDALHLYTQLGALTDGARSLELDGTRPISGIQRRHARQVNPLTVQVMAELGIDILPQGVHQLSDYFGQPFDLVVTVCDTAAEECPVFPGAKQQFHWSFADPSLAVGTDAERLAAFRHIRDLIHDHSRQWLASQGG